MAAIKHQGLTDGVTSEWTIMATVKPGQEEAFREYAKAQVKKSLTTEDVVIAVGTVHDYRYLVTRQPLACHVHVQFRRRLEPVHR